jgi:hypothetical protein
MVREKSAVAGVRCHDRLAGPGCGRACLSSAEPHRGASGLVRKRAKSALMPTMGRRQADKSSKTDLDGRRYVGTRQLFEEKVGISAREDGEPNQ